MFFSGFFTNTVSSSCGIFMHQSDTVYRENTLQYELALYINIVSRLLA